MPTPPYETVNAMPSKYAQFDRRRFEIKPFAERQLDISRDTLLAPELRVAS